MNDRSYLLVSATVFALVSLLHLGRLAFQVSVEVNDAEFPSWLSVIGLFVSGGLSAWGFRLARR